MSSIYTVDGTVIDTGHDQSYYEEIAKTALTGKVMVCLGDSYTVGMGSQLETIARKYGMKIDNRGRVSASISYRPTSTNLRMPVMADAIVSDYTNGYAIDGTTYTAEDVAVITFMGGANDGPGVETWIGTGLHETDQTTIYGSLNHIFSTFQETFTNAKIICITQPSFYVDTVANIKTDAYAKEIGFDDLAEAEAFTDVQYTNYQNAQKENAVRYVAWAYQITVVDMFNEFPAVNNPSNRSVYWQSDKLHLTKAGYDLVANAIDKKIARVYGE